jgi:hypothetical protein
VNETNSSTISTNFQIRGNRIIRAAVLVAQGALLLRQESIGLLSCRHGARLREISYGLQQLVPALTRLGRALQPNNLPERIPPQFVTKDERVSAGGLQ